MTVTDPRELLDAISHTRLHDILDYRSAPRSSTRSLKKAVTYVEPGFSELPIDSSQISSDTAKTQPDTPLNAAEAVHKSNGVPSTPSIPLDVLDGKIQRLGDFIDTDALAPAESLTTCKTDEEFGEFCLIHTHPDFRSRAKHGFNVVVAGKAFGCGSSRENAVSALKGCGIACVIAKSFAFIYGRNQPNLGLLGITITDERFYDVAADGAEIKVDLARRKVSVGGEEWGFELSAMELKLIETGGIAGAFRRFGKKLFEEMCAPSGEEKIPSSQTENICESVKEIQW